MLKFPGSEIYDCKHPWVYEDREDGLIAADLFIYVDNGRTIGRTEEILWEAWRKWVSTCYWIGMQDTPKKVKPQYQAPGPWAVTFTSSKEGVYVFVSKDLRDKTWGLIQEVRNTEEREKETDGMDRVGLDSIRGFLVYVSKTY